VVSTAREEFLSPQAAGDQLGVSVYTVRRWIQEGRIPAYKPGKEYRIRESDLEEFLRTREVRPKVSASPEPSFNDVLADERREAIFGPWLEFVNHYADQWEARLAAGDFDLGNLDEFIKVSESLMSALHELNRAEVRELPKQPYSFGLPEAKTGRAIERLLDLIDPMLAAAAEKFPQEVIEDELEPLRRKRDEAPADLDAYRQRSA
jgi:excisionase family DNA binding protein